MNNETQIKSYVRYKDKWFLVSTIERESSAAIIPPVIYNETIVWEWNEETKERGKIIAKTGENKKQIFNHNQICQSLYSFGTWQDQE